MNPLCYRWTGRMERAPQMSILERSGIMEKSIRSDVCSTDRKRKKSSADRVEHCIGTKGRKARRAGKMPPVGPATRSGQLLTFF